jgi:hypothetical protein
VIELDSLKSKLYDRTPLLGAGRRRQAAETLALLEDADAVGPLAEALVGLEDEAVHKIAADRLTGLQDPAGIDVVCALWARTRHPRLAAIVAEHGWIAREPYDARVIGLLAAGGAAAMADAMPELVPALVDATEDHVAAIADAAWAALAGLTRQDAREALCAMVLELDDRRAVKAVRDGGHVPDDPRQRALLLMLTEQGEAYAAADPAGDHLAEALRVADPDRRRYMAEKARDLRLVPWAHALMRRPTTELQPVEWDALLLVLAEAREFAALWRLVPVAPVTTSVAYLRYLRTAGWAPPADAPDAALFRKLSALVPRCQGDPAGLALRIREVTIFEGKPGQATCLALSPDWRYLAVGGDDHVVRVFSLPDGALVTTIDGLPGWTRALSFGASGRYLAIATMKHQTRVYRLPDGLPVTYLDTRDVAAVALRGDAALMATASGQRVDLWNVEAGQILRSLPAHGRLVKGLAIGARGCTLASWGADGKARVWTLPDGAPIGTIEIEGEDSGVTSLAMSPDESRIAIASADHFVRVFSLPDGELLAELPGDGQPVRSMSFRPDGEQLAVAGHNHRVRIFTIPNGDPLGVAEGYGGAGVLAWNGMGQLLAAAAEGKRTVKLWMPAAPPLTEDTVATARPWEIAWAQRLHRDPSLSTEEHAWLTYWGTLVLAARGTLPAAPGADGAASSADDPHPWEVPRGAA